MGQSFTNLLSHMIFSTKDRLPQIDPDLRPRLYDSIGGIVRRADGALLSAGCVEDHVHLLVTLHPASCVADVVRLVKANSSKWVHETFPARQAFQWQTGYAAFSVSQSGVDDVRSYIARHEEHHRRTTFRDELLDFLRCHEMEYDERYIWA